MEPPTDRPAWELSNYADFDKWRAHEDKTFRNLVEELNDFFLPGSDQAALVREIRDVRITELAKPGKVGEWEPSGRPGRGERSSLRKALPTDAQGASPLGWTGAFLSLSR